MPSKTHKEYHDKGTRRDYKRPPQPRPTKMKAKSKIRIMLIGNDEFNLEKLKDYSDRTHEISWRETVSFPDMFLHEDKLDWATDKALEKLQDAASNMFHELSMEFPAYEKEYKEKERYYRLFNHTIEDCERYGEEDKMKKLVHRICKEHKFTSKELDYFNVHELEQNITTRGTEYISIHMHTSTWTYYAKSHVIIHGKKYESEVQYDSETNRV